MFELIGRKITSQSLETLSRSLVDFGGDVLEHGRRQSVVRSQASPVDNAACHTLCVGIVHDNRPAQDLTLTEFRLDCKSGAPRIEANLPDGLQRIRGSHEVMPLGIPAISARVDVNATLIAREFLI